MKPRRVEIYELRRALTAEFGASIDLDVLSDREVVITIVSQQFEGLSSSMRRDRVGASLACFEYEAVLMDLMTPAEADDLGIAIAPFDPERTGSVDWSDAVDMLRSGQQIGVADRTGARRRVVFYSYKGGVGRTTSLVHVGFSLARSGMKVVLVDLDLEAPGLRSLLPPSSEHPREGMVDLIWERATRPNAAQPEFSVDRLLYAVEDPKTRREVFVMSAGTVSEEYIERLGVIQALGHDALDRIWRQFEEEVSRSLSLDVILIDARTGFNVWGGLSLLNFADDAFIFAYPTPQNTDGLKTILTLVREVRGIEPHVVFSPVPDNALGKELAARTASALMSDSSDEGASDDGSEEPPLTVYQHPSISTAERYPVESSLSMFESLAGLIQEQRAELRVTDRLQGEGRWSVIRSFAFPERDPDGFDYRAYFQRTPDFDRATDADTWIIAGRKGTGKSTLYGLLAAHQQLARSWASSRLAGVNLLSGHGNASSFRPSGSDEFARINRNLRGPDDWISLWRAYAVIVLYRAGELDELAGRLGPLLTHLATRFRDAPRWLSEHTSALIEMVTEHELAGRCKDTLVVLDEHLRARGEWVWLLYDDLDQDIGDGEPWRRAALHGLFALVYDIHNVGIRRLRSKVFIRLDIWERLVFTNKSHFGSSRVSRMRWRIEDFLRLTWRLAANGSPEYCELAHEAMGIESFNPEEADEEALREALAPLWGQHIEKSKRGYTGRWVYSRLSDTAGNAFPRSLGILLTAAREHELTYVTAKKRLPSDRLLRQKSLKEGFEEASRERAHALREEFPKLAAFFARLPELRSKFSRDALRPLWEDTAASDYDSLETFIADLLRIGLIQPASSGEYEYEFARIYIDGFKIKRVGGEKK